MLVEMPEPCNVSWNKFLNLRNSSNTFYGAEHDAYNQKRISTEWTENELFFQSQEEQTVCCMPLS